MVSSMTICNKPNIRMKEGELRNLRAFVAFPLFVVRYSFWLEVL